MQAWLRIELAASGRYVMTWGFPRLAWEWMTWGGLGQRRYFFREVGSGKVGCTVIF